MRTTVSWRYLVLGLGFLVLGGVRAAQGAPVWAVVFVLAAGANAWLAVRGDGRTPAPTAPDVADPDEVERERGRCLTALRQWQALGLGAVLVAAGLLLIEPPLAVLGGAAALFAVSRARRVRRYAATLPPAPSEGGATHPVAARPVGHSP